MFQTSLKMSDTTEVLVTSDSSASLWSTCVWDINTGTSIHSYKGGGVSAPSTISLIANDYMISAERLKPLLHVWPINSQETIKNTRFLCPGRVSALTVSSDGKFCAAGIEEKLYVWQIATGRLLSIASKHFQPITKVVFTSDASHIVTAGEDGLMLIWPLAHLISQQANDLISQSVAGQTDPLHTLSDHSMPIKDICIGKSGLHARLVSVSADRTMKIYELISGTLLLTVVFDECLTAVTMNLSETSIYVGTVDGSIFELSLLNPPRNREYHVNKSETALFKGHTKSITALSVSVDGQTLASGSFDEQVIIWHIQTKQKIRTIPHKGAITNAFFAISPKNLFVHDLKPVTMIKPFQRSTEEDSDGIIEVIHTKDQQLPYACISEVGEVKEQITVVSKEKELESEVEKLKAINAKLYQFTLNKIVQVPTMTESKENGSVNGSGNKFNKKKRKRMSME